MGDTRFQKSLDDFLQATDRALALRRMEDEEVVAALAAASRLSQPLVSNVLATEALNRIRRLRASLAHLGNGVVALDLEGRILWANSAAERLVGWSRARMIGHRFIELMQGSDFGLPQATSGRGPAALDDAWVVRSDGRRLCLDCTCAPILTPEGDVEGLVLAFTDCTRRRQAEERYRSLFENSPDAIVSMAPDGTIMDANPAAEALTHAPATLVRGHKFQEFLHPADVERAVGLFMGATSFRAVRARIRILHSDGSEIPVDAVGIPIVVAGEVVGLHGVARPAVQ